MMSSRTTSPLRAGELAISFSSSPHESAELLPRGLGEHEAHEAICSATDLADRASALTPEALLDDSPSPCDDAGCQSCTSTSAGLCGDVVVAKIIPTCSQPSSPPLAGSDVDQTPSYGARQHTHTLSPSPASAKFLSARMHVMTHLQACGLLDVAISPLPPAVSAPRQLTNPASCVAEPQDETTQEGSARPGQSPSALPVTSPSACRAGESKPLALPSDGTAPPSAAAASSVPSDALPAPGAEISKSRRRRLFAEAFAPGNSSFSSDLATRVVDSLHSPGRGRLSTPLPLSAASAPLRAPNALPPASNSPPPPPASKPACNPPPPASCSSSCDLRPGHLPTRPLSAGGRERSLPSLDKRPSHVPPLIAKSTAGVKGGSHRREVPLILSGSRALLAPSLQRGDEAAQPAHVPPIAGVA